MTDAVLGFDCPRGWGLWTERGPVAAGVVDGDSLLARRCVVDAAFAAADAAGVAVVGALVETPFGEAGEVNNPRSLATYGRGVGWVECDLSRRNVFTVCMQANIWRSHLRFPGRLSQEEAKRLAIAMATKAAAETSAPKEVVLVGPEGGKRPDTCEGLCISMVAWLHFKGWTGAMQAWKERNNFSMA